MELLIIYFSDQTDAKLDTNTENFIMRLQRSPKNLMAGTQSSINRTDGRR